MRRNFTGLLASTMGALALASCASSDGAGQSAGEEALPPFSGDRAHPQLALAEHLLSNYFANNPGKRSTTCIATHDGREEVAIAQEDELALMMRFPGLAPMTRCVKTDGVWRDSDSGEPAILFTLHTFSCADLATCSGFGGFILGDTSSLTSRYTMDYGGRFWTFTRDDRLIGAE